MAKRIQDISIFGEYGQAENRLTVALLQILKEGKEPLIRHFAQDVGFEIPSNEIDICTQVAASGCTPDGLLESRFSFSLVIESKAKANSINSKQLAMLLEDQKERGTNSTLLYLTPDRDRPKLLENNPCVWASWLHVRDSLLKYLEHPEIEQRELLEFLVDHFTTFATNLGVLGEPWIVDESRVLVVPAREALGLAKRFNNYVCQNRRSFKPSGWLAFYANGQIDTIARISGPPEDDVIMTQRPEFAEVLKYHPSPEEPRRVLRLSDVQEVGPIKNDLRHSNKTPELCSSR